MSSLKNCLNTGIPTSVFSNYLKLYKNIGLGASIISFLDEKHGVYKEICHKNDIFYLYKLLSLDTKTADSRINQFIEKKTGETVRNNNEQLIKNLVYVFELIEGSNELIVDSQELYNLAIQLTKGMRDKNAYKRSDKMPYTYREKIDEICKEYNEAIRGGVDLIYVSCAFLVDFLHLSPFNYYNEFVGIIMFYALLKTSDIDAFSYFSFFKDLYERKAEYELCLMKGFHLIDQNVNDVFELVKLMLDIALDSYDGINEIYDDLSFDKQLKKKETVEAVIYKLPETFSKGDIMDKLPGISVTTVDRCLKSLSSEGKIVPFGKGRNAKWVRMDKTHDKTNFD